MNERTVCGYKKRKNRILRARDQLKSDAGLIEFYNPDRRIQAHLKFTARESENRFDIGIR